MAPDPAAASQRQVTSTRGSRGAIGNRERETEWQARGNQEIAKALVNAMVASEQAVASFFSADLASCVLRRWPKIIVAFRSAKDDYYGKFFACRS